jgi:hypothetical protein
MQHIVSTQRLDYQGHCNKIMSETFHTFNVCGRKGEGSKTAASKRDIHTLFHTCAINMSASTDYSVGGGHLNCVTRR